MNSSCAFNPKNKPIEKIGTCKGEEHYDLTDKPKRGVKVFLWMLYSDEYNKFMENDKSDWDDNDFDKAYEEIEKKQYKPNSERYYCETCHEVNCE